MRALVSVLSRAALSIVLSLMALAVLRWAPVHAEPPWDVRALPLAPAALGLAVLAALTGGPPRGRPARWWRPLTPRRLLLVLLAATAALALVVARRPPGGLPAEASGPQGPVGDVAAGPVELSGPRLRSLPAVRRWTFRWEGELRVENSGAHRLWATGRGQVEVRLDGRLVLAGEGDPLRAGAEVPIGRGAHRLEVTLRRVGAGPRLRLGWTRPDGWDETIAPRALGPPLPPWWWRATDALALLCAALVGLLAWRSDWSARRPLPAPGRVGRGELLASLAGHAALAALMSWPLLADPARLGVMDRPDGRLNAWILAWDAHALFHRPARVFQAPAFHPLPDALAFSENLLLPAALASPALLLGGPVLGYNAALLLSMVVSGLGAQLLARRVSGARLAAFVGGAVFGVGAHRWIRLAHLHAQATLFLPFVLLAFDRFWRRRDLRSALLLGLLLALQALSSVYIGAVAAVAFAAATACALLAGLRGRELARLAAGTALAGLLVAPALAPYLRMRAFQGVEWTREQVASYATTLESYAAAGTRLHGRFTQAHLDPQRVQDTLFPGLVPLALGVAGLAVAPRRYRAVALVGTAAAVTLSLGPQTALYRFLYEHVVLVRGLRALSRLSLLPVLALSVLAGLALARARGRHALLALALMLVESTNAPIRYARYEGPSEAHRWLAGRTGAVVELPAGEDDTRAMLDGLAHLRPLVNGDSGFMPRPYTRALELLSGPDHGEALRFLRAVGVTQALSREPRPWAVAARFGEAVVYEIPPGEAARAVAPARAAPTLWHEEAVADLGAARTVERVVFELDERPWVAAPEIAVSLDGRDWVAVPARASLADATLSLYADPRAGRGEVRLAPVSARFVRLDARLPARRGAIAIAVGRADPQRNEREGYSRLPPPGSREPVPSNGQR